MVVRDEGLSAMRCTRCGTELLPGKKFCHACGASALTACANCGAQLEPDWRFCPDCGRAQGAAAPEPVATVAPPAPAAPSPSPSPSDARLALLARHIPETLADQIRAAGAVAGERKRAAVLFCDLVGSTALAERLDPEEYRELLGEYLELVLAEIYRFEGIVNQLAGDGMMALFGAPIAHEDAPERAVLAALEIQRQLGRLSERLEEERGVSLRARIGIHTGVVVAGTVGNELKMDYTATGDTTNLAARLQSLAEPGTILVSEATHALLRGRFRTTAVGPLDVKGKTEPVHAFVVEGPAEKSSVFAAAPGEMTPFVGRDAELGQIVSCFERLGSGLAQIVSVVGDAGIGKSRLVYQFKKALKGRDVELLETRCSSLTRSVPYAPWVSMFRRWFGIESGDDEATASNKVAAKFTDERGVTDPGWKHLSWMLGLAPDAPSDESVPEG